MSLRVTHAQDSLPTPDPPRVLMGVSWGSIRITHFNTGQTYTAIQVNPHFGAFLGHWGALGFEAEYGAVRSNFVDNEDYFGGAIWGRGYGRIPQGWYVPWLFERGELRQSVRPFVEVAHAWSSWYIRGGQVRFLDMPSISEWRASVGVNLQVYRKLFASFSYGYAYRPNPNFPHGPNIYGRVGLDYWLGPKTADPVSPPPRPKSTARPAADSQSVFRPHVRVGLTFTYWFDLTATSRLPRYHELIGHLNVTFLPRKSLGLGVSVHPIFAYGSTVGTQWYGLAGAYGRLYLVNHPRFRWFGEIGLYRGNYCSCEQLDPYRIPFAWYRGLVGGMSFRVAQGWFLEVAMLRFKLLQDEPTNYPFGLYSLGMSYQIGGR
mgnify:CR=1 FL=1